MTHVVDGTLMAFLDDALDPGERAAVAAHLGHCPACAADLESLHEATAQFSAAVAVLDRPAPVAEARAAVERRLLRERGAGIRRNLLRAAALIIGFAAVGSAAIPDSPLREWIGAAWRQVAGPREEAGPEPAVPAMVSGAEHQEPAGISILPSSGEARILVVGASAESRIRVRLTDGDRVAVQARGGAADARFATGPDRLEVRGGGPGELLIDVPRALRVAVVEVDGRVFVTKEGDVLRARVPAQTAGAEVVFPILNPNR